MARRRVFLADIELATVKRASIRPNGKGKSMKIRHTGRFATGLAAVVLQFLATGAASAHHPEISAVAVCDDNDELVIEYTATAWLGSTAAKRTNTQVDILVNNVKVGQGAFTSPNFSFSGSTDAPPGDSATVTAFAVASWGNGFAGGQ
jgi:hypothetical protein